MRSFSCLRTVSTMEMAAITRNTQEMGEVMKMLGSLLEYIKARRRLVSTVSPRTKLMIMGGSGISSLPMA